MAKPSRWTLWVVSESARAPFTPAWRLMRLRRRQNATAALR